MSDPVLIRETHGAVATLTLNNPAKLNALSEAMLDALHAEMDVLHQDSSVRAVILKGAGRAFCAGHDLKEMTAGRQAEDAGKAYFEALFAKCAKLMLSIQRLPQPVIAQVHGLATAAGCQLVATCDMAVAAEGTKFGVNGVNIGLFCSTPMVALTRAIPRKQAFEMLTTGQFIESERATTLGLINKAVPPDQLETETQALAELVTSKLGAAVKIGKQAFYTQTDLPIQQAYAYASEVMVTNMLERETEAGIDAFLGKRDHKWNQGNEG